MVNLHHPEIARIAASLPVLPDRRLQLEHALNALRQRVTYQEDRVYRTPDQVFDLGHANCLSLSAVLASLLRQLQFPAPAVHVAVGNYKGFWVENIHAWTLVQTEPGDSLWMIDPKYLHMKRERRKAIWDVYNFIVLFNDQELRVGRQEQASYFSGEEQEGGSTDGSGRSLSHAP